MRATIAASFLVSLIYGQAHLKVKPEDCSPHKEIFCGNEKHVLSKYDCDRGLVWMYCTKTLRRTPPSDRCLSPDLLDWNRSQPWRLIITSAPIFTLPCLSMDDSSLTLICQENKCDDSTLDEDIMKCMERYSRGLVQYIERPEGSKRMDGVDSYTDKDQLLDTRTLSALSLIVLLHILPLLALQLIGTCLNATKLEKVHYEICLSAPLPLLPTALLEDCSGD